MNYITVSNYFTQAIDIALERIRNNMYPSIWSTQGSGWQEQWKIIEDSKNTAGVYASCEGIIALREIHTDMDVLRDKVYVNHLCAIFDDKAPAGNNIKTRVRGRSLYTTYKLAHFLLASSYITQNNEYKLIIQNAIVNLYANYIHSIRMFAPSNNKEFGCVLATSDALVALHSIRNLLAYDNKIFTSCILKFTELFHSYDFDNPHDNISEKVIVLWTISYLKDYFDESTIIAASKKLMDLVRIISELKYKRDIIKFSVKYYDVNDDKDYYSLNIQIQLIDAIINLIEKSYIDKSFFSLLLEQLISIAKNILSKGYYSTLDSHDKIEFWENYQAIELLKHSNILITEEFKKGGDELMIVSPKIFKETAFIQDSKLVFVIMPFGESWSTDVYSAFKDALEPNGYTVWRADLITKDEVIIQKIWEQINRSKFIIADCTGRNPNVFYELGISHVVGKPVFMCAQNSDDFPFDINHIKYFLYKTSYSEMQNLIIQLKQFAQDV